MQKERLAATEVVKRWGMDAIEESMPISIIGTGGDMNKATQNGLERAAALFDTTVPEVKNRATITGAVDIGRAPGVVHTCSVRTSEFSKKSCMASELCTAEYMASGAVDHSCEGVVAPSASTAHLVR